MASVIEVFTGGVSDAFLGGAERDAARAQQEALERGQLFTREGIAQAREDVNKLFPAAQQNAQAGFQGALDIFGQSAPAQIDAFQGGNVAAQQQLLAGMPQFQNAILGNQVDFSQLQPFQAPTQDLGFLQQQLPDFIDPFNLTNQQIQEGTANQPVNTGGGANNNPALPPNVIANLLGGGSTTPQFGAPNLGGFTADRFNLRSRF
jgi:hypothetical protein